jgi:hypothetical protein
LPSWFRLVRLRVSLSDIARVLCYSVGISWIRKPLIPRIGCGRLAQFSGIGEENHVVSKVLQVALLCPNKLSVRRNWAPHRYADSILRTHCCPEFSERTAQKWPIYKGFSDILAAVDLNSVTPDEAISRGGRAGCH